MLLKFTRAAFTLSIAVLGPFSTVACGSDTDGEGALTPSGSGSSSSTGAGGSAPINVTGGSNSGGGTTGTGRDGGTVELTPEEVEAIGDAACAGWTTEGESLPAALQLVVDVSGSMEEEAPGSNDSKWEVTRDALRDAIENLPASVSLGVLYYPNRQISSSDSARDVSACVNVDERIPMGVLGPDGDPHRSTIEDSLNRADTGSLTPTHDAYRHALEEGLIPYQTNARKFMLLITDGAPTMRLECIGQTGGGGGQVMDQPTQPIIDEIAGAQAQGISTFLIGSPGSEESSQGGDDMRPWLSRAAVAGGTASMGCDEDGPNFCHMDMTQEPDFAQALTDGLNAIVGQIIDSCTFVLPPPPAGETLDPSLTNLIINWSNGTSSLVLPDDVGDCSQGWRFDDQQQVVLCADTCDQAKADAGARVQLTFGCSVGEVVPVR